MSKQSESAVSCGSDQLEHCVDKSLKEMNCMDESLKKMMAEMRARIAMDGSIPWYGHFDLQKISTTSS